MSELKKNVALAALTYLDDDGILGIGTGTTMNYFIDSLVDYRHKIEGCVASSLATEQRLRALKLPVIGLNEVGYLPLYIDGADEVTQRFDMIKGGGGAHTREKILAAASRQFICIVDESKLVSHLGAHPVAVEVLPMARSFVARELVKLGGDPSYRDGFVTDNGNIILDVYHLNINEPIALENAINIIPGVVDNGIFANRLADKVLVAKTNGEVIRLDKR